MYATNTSSDSRVKNQGKKATVHRANPPHGLWAAVTLLIVFVAIAAAAKGHGVKTFFLKAIYGKHHHALATANRSQGAIHRAIAHAQAGRFEHIALTSAMNVNFTCVQVGPDHKLYASADDGRLFRFPINADGTLGQRTVIDSLREANGGARLISGFCFDPSSTASRVILWVCHGYYGFHDVPDWSGKVTRMSDPELDTVEDAIVGLPRSVHDHLNNQPSFGPDGALYFPQGCNAAKGEADKYWGYRPEHLLSGTILRLDTHRIVPGHPVNVRTIDGGGQYDPKAPGAPLTIYADGVRNAFDLVWASDGNLYVPNNGSCMGGNTPAGPGVPGLKDLQLDEHDFLFRITPGRYYGHPNPVQGHYVLNRGHPTAQVDPTVVEEYPLGAKPDDKYELPAADLGLHSSANGIIEYHGSAFGGRLDRMLLVARYNVGCDIMVLHVNGAGQVSIVNPGIAGLDGFANPLDLAEDPTNGNIYVAEYGGRKITLLRPVVSQQQLASVGGNP